MITKMDSLTVITLMLGVGTFLTAVFQMVMV